MDYIAQYRVLNLNRFSNFTTFGLQKDDIVIFFLWCFRKVRFCKMQFLKDHFQIKVMRGREITDGYGGG